MNSLSSPPERRPTASFESALLHFSTQFRSGNPCHYARHSDVASDIPDLPQSVKNLSEDPWMVVFRTKRMQVFVVILLEFVAQMMLNPIVSRAEQRPEELLMAEERSFASLQ